MARVKKTPPNLDSIVFATPEQKVLRLLLSEPTTSFTIRVISSKLKGIRGLGGGEGIQRILDDLEALGFVDFVDNRRAVRLHDDNTTVSMLKTLSAICDLESLRKLLEPISSRGILFGSRASGRSRSDSDYDVFVVTDQQEEVKKVAAGHPLGRALELMAWSPSEFDQIEKKDGKLAAKLHEGRVLWGNPW
jgi:hypothetical protein